MLRGGKVKLGEKQELSQTHTLLWMCLAEPAGCGGKR